MKHSEQATHANSTHDTPVEEVMADSGWKTAKSKGRVHKTRGTGESDSSIVLENERKKEAVVSDGRICLALSLAQMS